MNISHIAKLAENYGVAAVTMINRLRVLGFIVLLIFFSGASSAACEREIDTATREHLVANKGRDGATGDFPNFRSWLVGHFDFFRKNPNTSELKTLPDFWKKDIQDQESKRLPADYMQHLRSQNAAITCILLSVLDTRNSGDIPPKNQSAQQPLESQPRTNQQQQAYQQAQQSQAAQQQSQQAQQQAQQTQQLAAQNQTRADQARQGKRRRHEPENEASHCIQPDFGGLYGGMKNTCNFKVWYTYCGFRPKENSWLTGMSCEKQSFGSDTVSPGRTSASHTKGVEAIHWIACKDPAWALDAEFVPGQGVRGRCYTVGGK